MISFKKDEKILQKNLSCLDDEIREKIQNSPDIGELIPSKSGEWNLVIDKVFFHSRYNPSTEASRLISNFIDEKEERILIFFGAGLGYMVQQTILNPYLKIFWLEAFPGIMKIALSLEDYSEAIQNNRLVILVKPLKEDILFSSFKGLSSLPVNFIPHRESFLWKESEYIEFKYICESFFKKKDVNIATLSRFEKIWTRNILQNLPDILNLSPVSKIFNISPNVPIVIAGAGPSLFYDLDNLKKYRDEFLLISVDTALHILESSGIHPDLIYSVDPQAMNTSYLEDYTGDGKIVFDPTSSYHTLRLSENLKQGFFTSSPFPLTKMISDVFNEEIGDVPFGGSVSTNAIGLAELMKGSPVYLVGQDLAFTDGYAHCKGAVLEERLNFLESRFFRREKHNFRQIHALAKKKVTGYNGKTYTTNDKMLIFKKWFEDSSKEKNWINLTSFGAKLEGIPQKKFQDCFEIGKNSKQIQILREKIKLLAGRGKECYTILDLQKKIESIVSNLSDFEKLLIQGNNLSNTIYKSIENGDTLPSKIQSALSEMEKIDEAVSSKKNLNEIIGTAIQRIILMITEDYEVSLSLKEKKNPHLQIAKKSILLYEGLLEGCRLTKIQLKKVLYRVENYKNF
ncbi:MAG: DUF115 domain-containing protein [Leptospiraceae bacterium]|nr:motility associated factor glycosyltransferase family protein [Leptospiraceae bacterium]MCK6382318.1 DUF115 domain-containing protein [Leptospiraceae bacterium]NUM41031.1 motility associated factor glycosyltransferase family protein [Leptospiraceae bacterium]